MVGIPTGFQTRGSVRTAHWPPPRNTHSPNGERSLRSTKITPANLSAIEGLINGSSTSDWPRRFGFAARFARVEATRRPAGNCAGYARDVGTVTDDEIREALRLDFEQTADWRRSKAAEYPRGQSKPGGGCTARQTGRMGARPSHPTFLLLMAPFGTTT